MSSNNYFGFTHGGAQYGQAGSYQAAQTGYAVTPATYTTQRAAYETAYTPAATNSTPATAYATTYGAVSAGAGAAAGTYEYGYARPTAATYQTPVAATYSSADYTQQAKPAYTANAYAGTATRQMPLTTQPKVAYTSNTVSYPTQAPQPVAATYSTTYVNPQQTTMQPVKQDKKPVAKYVVPSAASSTYNPSSQQYSGFTASNIQATTPMQSNLQGPSWASYKKQQFMPHNPNQGGGVRRPRHIGKPQQIHYCDVCKISCGGVQTYKEHLEGQKHKKKEIASKSMSGSGGGGGGGASSAVTRHGNSIVCQLCVVTCTGADAYAAHIRGAKHQKVVKLHTQLGKPIPAVGPLKKEVKKEVKPAPPLPPASSAAVAPAAAAAAAATPAAVAAAPVASTSTESAEPTDMDTVEPEVEPVGLDYLEEIRTDDGKLVFNCKLCDCKFNDPNAREMHMKGRRHRMQYKKKVDPSLVVDVKVNSRVKKIHDERMKRMLHRDDYFRQQSQDWGYPVPPMMPRPYDGPMGPMMGPPFFPGMRRPPTSDDRHVLARHTAIYPKPEELDAVHKIIAHNEKALKLVSDQLAEEAEKKAAAKTGAKPAVKVENAAEEKKVESTDQSMLSFQQGGEAAGRVLKGAMRVGNLAKGLLLTGDTSVALVVICGEKPTKTLISRVAEILPKQLEVAAPEETYKTLKKPDEACIVVMDVKEPHYTVTITFTSPLMRDAPPDQAATAADGSPRTPASKDPADVLDKQKCLDALAALRHAKWFQARAKSMQSCVMTIRIFRDLCQRVPTWAPLSSWAIELLIEKVLSSATGPLSLGEAVRRVMEAVSAGVLLPNGPGLMDPCEKEPTDAVGQITNQQREDVTASAQQALRLIAFRQIHKVLGMDLLPPPKGFKFQRKRRLEGGQTDNADGGADGKKPMITDA